MQPRQLGQHPYGGCFDATEDRALGHERCRSGLGAANLTGQATASAAGRLAATQVAKATCSSARTGNEAIVDLDSHRSFARLRTVCVGTLKGTGVIDAGALFVLQDVGPVQDANTEVVPVDLATYAVAVNPPCRSQSMFAGLGDIWAVTASYASSLMQLSPSSLRVGHRFADPDGAWDFLPFAGRLWFIDNYSLKTLNPINGRVSVARPSWLPAGLSPASVTSSGGELYLLAASKKSSSDRDRHLQPVSGAHRVVSETDLGGGSGLAGRDWQGPLGQPTSRQHVRGDGLLRTKPQTLDCGFSGGVLNGTWTAVPDIGDLWFQLAGSPLECVSGKTGRLTRACACRTPLVRPTSPMRRHRGSWQPTSPTSSLPRPDAWPEPLGIRYRCLQVGPKMSRLRGH